MLIGVKSLTFPPIKGHQKKIDDPNLFNGIKTNNKGSLDVRHKTDREYLCIDGWKIPIWLHDSFAAVRAGNAGNKRLPRLIPVLTIDRLSELPQSIANDLMQMYVKRGNMGDALHVFDNMQRRDVVSWNIMILGYAKHEEAVRAFDMYVKMHQEGVKPSARTFVGALKACSSLATLEEATEIHRKFVKIGCLEKGRAIHSPIAMSGFELDVYVGTTLVDVYAKCGSMEDAWCVFDVLPHRDVVCWNAMILGYAEQHDSALALELYAQMIREGISPSERTFIGTLKACSSMAAMEEGKQVDGQFMKSGCLEKGRAIHLQVIKGGFESDIFTGTTLVDMYVKCKSIKDARCTFDEMPHRNVFTWTAMILGYAEQEESDEAFRLYGQMQEQRVSPDSVVFVAMLKACGSTASLKIGKELHSQIGRFRLETITIIANSLIDMYAKCGSMVDAQQFFDALPTRDVVTWNSLIAGYARQGESELAFRLFERMRQESIQPDEVTFLSVLTACSHSGLANKGKKYFQTMGKRYGIFPSIEHYTCLVDLFGRAGQVDEAVAMVEKMPFLPDGAVWLSVLSACQRWNNVEVGRHAFKHAVSVDEKLPAAYVLMSNFYADILEEAQTELVDRSWQNDACICRG